MSLSRVLLILILLIVGIYLFLQMPESEPYKLPSNLTALEMPNTVIANETFTFYIRLSYNIPFETPTEIKNYISQYGDAYIIGDKQIKLYQGNYLYRTSTTNSSGIARFTLSLSQSIVFDAVFEGSTLLQKCTLLSLEINVSNQPHNDISLSLSENPISLIQGENKTLTLTITPYGNVEGTYNLAYEPTVTDVTISFNPLTIYLSTTPTTVNVNILTSKTATGTFDFTIKVIGATIEKTISLHVTVQQYTSPSVTLTADKYIIELSETSTLYATVSNGMPPFSYTFYMNNNIIQQTTTNTYTFTPNAIANYTFYVSVTDKKGNNAISNTITINVLAQLPKTELYLTNTHSRIDIDGNGIVDVADVNIILTYYGKTVPPAPEYVDINEDGKVNIYDSNIVSSMNGTSITGSLYSGNTVLVSNIQIKNSTIYLTKIPQGTYKLTLKLITEEQVTETLTLNTNTYYWRPTLSNPWKPSASLRLLTIFGETETVLIVKILGLTLILLVLAISLLMWKKKI